MTNAPEVIESLVDRLGEDTCVAARRTVAHWATGREDLVLLLDMLGLHESPAVPEIVVEPAPAKSIKCSNGHSRPVRVKACPVCRAWVPINDLLILVHLIQRETNLHPAAIARGAGLDESSFAVTLRKAERVRASTYAAVLSLTERLKLTLPQGDS